MQSRQIACCGSVASGAAVNLENRVTPLSTRYGLWLTNPLCAAVKGKYTGLVTMLLDAGALVNIEPGSKIPLSMAAAMGDQELVKTLIKAQLPSQSPRPLVIHCAEPLALAKWKCAAYCWIKALSPMTLKSIKILVPRVCCRARSYPRGAPIGRQGCLCG